MEVSLAEGIHREPPGGSTADFAACFDARGARIAIEIRCDEEWRALVAALGAPKWATAPSLATPRGRLVEQTRIEAELAVALRDEAPYSLMARLQEAGVPCGVVQEGPQILRDPQLAHRRHFVVLDHAVLGRMPYERSGFRLSATPGGFDDSAPLLGEDGDVVFGEILKLQADEIARLVAEGVIEVPEALSTRGSS
jgi:benzylsuccinate CoA-transferase BbsF subunit